MESMNDFDLLLKQLEQPNSVEIQKPKTELVQNDVSDTVDKVDDFLLTEQEQQEVLENCNKIEEKISKLEEKPYMEDEKFDDIRDILPNKGMLENLEKVELEFVDVFLSFQDEMNALKSQFKLKCTEYKNSDVNTRLIMKTVRQIAKNRKISPEEVKNEDRIYRNLTRNENLVSRIANVLN